MRMGAMLTDVIRALFQRPATRQYPFVRTDAPERLRGRLHWDGEKCTGCSLCVKDCPAQALEVFMVDKATKRVVLRYHLDRCTYCAQCVVSCRQSALTMSHDEWELADTDKVLFTITCGDDADVQRMEELAPKDAVEQP